MANHEIFGCHVSSVSIILVSITFVTSTLIAGATAFVPLNDAVLVTVIGIAVLEITTSGMHIIAIRESESNWLLPNLIVSAFNIVLSVVLCVLSVIDMTSGSRIMGTEVLIILSPSSLAVDESDANDVSAQPSNSTSILTISILLSTLYVISTLYNVFVLHVHVKCYRFLADEDQQLRQWNGESTVSLFPELTETYDYDWAKKPRTITSIKEEDEDDFYYQYLAE